jgi:hypothetical protein
MRTFRQGTPCFGDFHHETVEMLTFGGAVAANAWLAEVAELLMAAPGTR